MLSLTAAQAVQAEGAPAAPPTLDAQSKPTQLKTVPLNAQCPALPRIAPNVHIGPGEELDYDLDVLTANAARMEMVTLPVEKGVMPLRVRIQTNTFFAKVRRVHAEAKSYLGPKSLHPLRYTEDASEDDDRRLADVDFHPRGQSSDTVAIKTATNPKGPASYTTVYGHFGNDALDVAGAISYLRAMDMKAGTPLCFDAYAMRHMWRVWGKVVGIEKVPSPMGEVDAFHIEGTAARLDNNAFQREMHVWITADEKRIPIGAMGGIDLGPVRATLTYAGHVGDDSKKESRAKGLDWDDHK
jgi:hypothetical protein